MTGTGADRPAQWAAALPGVALAVLLAVVLAGVAWVLGRLIGAGPLAAGVAVGAVAGNVGAVPDRARPGLQAVARWCLRAGVVVLGLRLSAGDLQQLGAVAIGAVTAGACATFAGVRWLARRLGVSDDVGLLVASGYSVCGASAIAAVNGVHGADDDDVAVAVGLVTLFGTVSIVALPAAAGVLGLDAAQTGASAGAAVHDVGQVVATSSAAGATGLAVAIVVKLCRVVLLAPLVAGVAAVRARRARRAGTPGTTVRARTAVPAFVVGFLAAAALRTTGVVPPAALTMARSVEAALLCLGMVALGTGVRVGHLRRLGLRPVALGLAAWGLVAAIGLAVAHVVATG